MNRIHLGLIITSVLSLCFGTTNSAYAQQSTPPACQSDTHREFDFWLGEWTVSAPDGSTAGHNTLTAIEGGCAIREEWRSATSAFTGTSYNFYDQARNEWRQLWLDNQGGVLDLAGNKSGNQMILKSAKQDNAAGQSVYHQITWTANADGSVRQLWETFTAEQPVVVAFDGLYVRTKTE